MEYVNVAEARKMIGRLLDAVATGQEVIITRRGKPAAKLTKVGNDQSVPLCFPDRQSMRDRLPSSSTSSSKLIRDIRNERY